MGDPPPLKVDPPALTWDPAVVTVPPVPVIPAGGDPMSTLISAVMPGIAAELNAAVAATRAREERFAGNLAGARAAYQSTDQSGGEEIRTVADTQLAPSTTAPAAGGTGAQGQVGQFMSTAMQMGGQMAQAPAQLAGMVASAPQAVMQAGQGAVQQISQLAGQSEKPEDGTASTPPVEQLVGHNEDDSEQGEQQPPAEEGADAGASAVERAPEAAPEGEREADRLGPIDL